MADVPASNSGTATAAPAVPYTNKYFAEGLKALEVSFDAITCACIFTSVACGCVDVDSLSAGCVSSWLVLSGLSQAERFECAAQAFSQALGEFRSQYGGPLDPLPVCKMYEL